MKSKELEKFKNKSVAQLNKEIADLRDKAWETKQSIIIGKEKNVRKTNVIRKSIAQLATIKSRKMKEEASNENKADKPVKGKGAGKLANSKETK